MKIVLKATLAEGQAGLLDEALTTPWEIEIWNSADGLKAYGEMVATADAVVSMLWNAGSPPAPKLKLLQLPGAGHDAIEFASVPEGAAVCNCFEHEIGVAEFVIAAVLMRLTRIAEMDRHLRLGDWSDSLLTDGPMHAELHGRTVGIIGYGHIARALAERLGPFGARVLACTRTPEKADDLADAVHGMERLDWMLELSDVVVVTCPLSEETRGLIDATALARMKEGAILVNVARGPIVDEEALYRALVERRIAAAVIDTWYSYPKRGEARVNPSRLPFHELDNVVMTPHAASWTEGLLPRRYRFIAANLDRLARREALENVILP